MILRISLSFHPGTSTLHEYTIHVLKNNTSIWMGFEENCGQYKWCKIATSGGHVLNHSHETHHWFSHRKSRFNENEPTAPKNNINAELMASSIWLIKHKYLDMNSI